MICSQMAAVAVSHNSRAPPSPTLLQVDLNASALLGRPGSSGGCFSAIEARAGGAASAHKQLKLWSDAGEVTVTLQQAGGANTAAPYNQSTYTPPGKPPGLRLAQADARRLMSTYGSSVGDLASTDELFLAIDAYFPSQQPEAYDQVPTPTRDSRTSLRGAQQGGARVRFLYVTNPTYLILDPARLRFLSAGLLAPPTAVERVSFLNDDCLLAPDLLSGPRANETLEAMYEQLFRSLHSSARDTRPLVRSASLCHA